MSICYPDYSRSLLSVIASISANFGVKTSHASLPMLDAELARGYKNVVLMLFDGLGTEILGRYLPPSSLLRRHVAAEISSVFPPTTTAATITVESGLAPIEHGWLGWSLYFEEIGANVSIFPNTLSGSGGVPAADYHVARRYLPYERLADKIKSAGKANAKIISPFAEPATVSVREICESIEQFCAEAGKKFVYAYWPQPDEDMHILGTSHGAVKRHIKEIEKELDRLCGKLSDTLLIVTADHGIIDVTWRFLPEYPGVTRCLARTPWMEPRAMAFAVLPGHEREFVREFNSAFGDCFVLFSREEALQAGLFGPGTPHPRANELLGDFTAAATGSVAIEVRERTEDVLRAAHAGLTDAEMRVPLTLIKT